MADVLHARPNRLELRAVLLFVDDFPRQLEFYRDVMGFEVSDEESGEGYVRLEDWVMLNTGGSLFELFDKRVHAEPLQLSKGGNAAVPAFEVRDVAESWERLSAHRVTTLTGLESREWGTFFFFEDPEGNALQAYQLVQEPTKL